MKPSILLLLMLLAGPGAASLGFLDNPPVRADLDDDGQNELIFLFYDDPGGSGTFVYLGVLHLDEQGNPRAAIALVGDRVQVVDLRVEEGRVVMETIQPGPGEPAARGSQKVHRSWRLQGDRLQEAPARILGPLTLEEIEGRPWRLVRLGDEAPPKAVTLRIEGGKLSGNGGCNRYFGQIQEEENAPERRLQVGPLGSTRMACEPSIMAFEQRYLAALRHVSHFDLQGRRLILRGLEQSTSVQLVFELASTESEAEQTHGGS